MERWTQSVSQSSENGVGGGSSVRVGSLYHGLNKGRSQARQALAGRPLRQGEASPGHWLLPPTCRG